MAIQIIDTDARVAVFAPGALQRHIQLTVIFGNAFEAEAHLHAVPACRQLNHLFNHATSTDLEDQVGAVYRATIVTNGTSTFRGNPETAF